MSDKDSTAKLAPVGIDRGISVLYHLEILDEWLNDPEVTEICINRPLEVWCERASKWERHSVPELTYDKLKSLGIAVAKFSENELSAEQPILSGVLPNDERIQVLFPDACEKGTVSITIRKPSFAIRRLSDYVEQGFFENIQPITNELSPIETDLLSLKNNGHYDQFLTEAVKHEKVIVVAGETGSGKTTFMRALMQEIPSTDRIITIEDVPELFLPNHPNHVHLFYPSEANEEKGDLVTAASLLKSCLRMNPTRILLAELRGGETFDFINVAASGHGGSITSCHAGTCELAFERLALMVLQNRQGRTLPYAIIRRLLYLVVDVIVHVHNDIKGDKGRHITEVWYDPTKKRQNT